MSERATHTVYLMGGQKGDGSLFIYEVFPETKTYGDAIRGPNAELIANAADAHLNSTNQFFEPQWIECTVYDNNGKLIGTTPRRSPIYQNIAQDVADLLHKDFVTITID